MRKLFVDIETRLRIKSIAYREAVEFFKQNFDNAEDVQVTVIEDITRVAMQKAAAFYKSGSVQRKAVQVLILILYDYNTYQMGKSAASNINVLYCIPVPPGSTEAILKSDFRKNADKMISQFTYNGPEHAGLIYNMAIVRPYLSAQQDELSIMVDPIAIAITSQLPNSCISYHVQYQGLRFADRFNSTLAPGFCSN